MTEHQAWVWLAQIRRSQGRKGEVLATILTDFPEKFAERRQLWLLENAGTPQERSRPATLAHFWLHKGSVVLHFDGVASITEAEALRDQVVAIPREQRAQLDPDAYYVGDLIGCTVVDQQPQAARTVGVIEDVDRQAGPVALLIVRGQHNQELLIPLAKSYLRHVDLEAKQIVMALPDGLLELNEPRIAEADHDA
jgi:16S rRNA processing protein RimM